MNRHERRSLEAIHEKFLSQLKPTIHYTPQQEKERQAFFGWLAELKQKGERPMVAHGALGEEIGRDAFIKDVIHPESGGTELSLWGITYRLKLNLQGLKLHNLDMAKWIAFQLPHMVMKHWLMATAFLATFSLQKKKLIRFLDEVFYQILARSVRWNNVLESEYNPAPKELKRAAIAVLERQGFSFEGIKVYMADFDFPLPDGTINHLFAELTLFIALFLELDTAYRFRVQDAFGHAYKSGYRGLDLFWQGLETLINREVSGEGVRVKWLFMKQIIRIGFVLVPDISKFVKCLMDEVLWITVAMDDADWYFCLRYLSYDFGGLPKEERFKLRDEIDKREGHLIFYA